ncbi:NAD(P)H-dependent flavin oxidoreductase [Bacteroidota bacterium]
MKPLRIGNLKINIPVIQGGMGVGISLSGLAAAVANEGGVGTISAAGIGLIKKGVKGDYLKENIIALRNEIRKAKEKTKGVLGVNVMVAMTNFADMVTTSIAEKIDIIFVGAGLPLNLPSYLKKDSVTKLVPIVSSGRAVKIICQKWIDQYNYLPDAIVVEGPKAGGHLGFHADQINNKKFCLESILKDVITEAKIFEKKYKRKIPVIAAGGIYTGKDVNKYLDLGASGVQMGTRFVTTDECDASEEFKQSYIKAKQRDIKIINSPVGLPGRAIESKFLNKVEKGEKQPLKCPYHCIRSCNIEKSPYCIVVALIQAYRGNFNHGFAFAGANAFRAKAIISVNKTFDLIKTEYNKAKEKYSKSFAK